MATGYGTMTLQSPNRPILTAPNESLIDIHSHLLPGIDDGCASVQDSLACVRRLKAAGFVGTICTPHVIPGMLPANTPANIAAWTARLRQEIQAAGLTFELWTGGELQMCGDAGPWMRQHGVPTLAGSRCVLFDFWADKWPRWLTANIEWLLGERYQPILAHPERIACCGSQPKQLQRMIDMGVWLQGNCRTMTGEDGYQADRLVRQFLREGKYHFLALDLHTPETLDGRLDGMQLVAMEFGETTLQALMKEAPRRLLFDR